MKKGLIITGAAVIAAAGILAGCGGSSGSTAATTASNAASADRAEEITAQSIAQMASDNMADADSYSFDGDTQMKYAVASSGMSMDMDMDIKLSGEGVVDTHESHIVMDMDMSVLGQEQKITNESYTVEEDGKYMVYSKTEGTGSDGSWKKAESGSNVDFERLNNMNVYQKIADGEIEATLSDGEKVNGKDTYRLDAVIPGELFREVYSAMGQEATQGISEIDFSNANARCELYIYKDSGLPARTYMDAKEYGESIFKQAMSQAGSEAELEITVDEFDVDMTMDNYNNIDSIDIPTDVSSVVQ